MSTIGAMKLTIESGVSSLSSDLLGGAIRDASDSATATLESTRRETIEDDGNSTDALADAFSTSLAQIAFSSGRRNLVVASEQKHVFATAVSTVSASSLESSATTASATPQTSSDDRDSSGSGCDAVMDEAHGSRTYGSRGNDACVHATALTATVASAEPSPSSEPYAEPVRAHDDVTSFALLSHRMTRRHDDRPHYHRHLKKHSIPTKVQELSNKPWHDDGDNVNSIAATASSKAIVSSPSSIPFEAVSSSSSIHIVHHHRTVLAHRLPLDSGSRTNIESSGGACSSAGDTYGTAGSPSLLQPFREPCFHTIRQTFKKFVKRASRKQLDDQDEFTTHGEDDMIPKIRKRAKRNMKRQPCVGASEALLLTMNKSLHKIGEKEEESGVSSGSGTEGGYVASNSSNGNDVQSESSSPSSEDSSEESGNERKRWTGHCTGDPLRPMLSKKRESARNSMSSEIDDFSSTYSINGRKTSRPESPSLSASSCFGEHLNQDDIVALGDEHQEPLRHCVSSWTGVPWQVPLTGEREARRSKKRGRVDSSVVRNPQQEMSITNGKPALSSIGCDIMAHVLTFLEPPEILDVLTMPLSKDWSSSFTCQSELWRVLCLLEPFKAQVDDDDASSDSENSNDESNVSTMMTVKISKFRLLYTSYVRCMRCLIRIKDDAINGRPPSSLDYTDGLERTIAPSTLGANQNLQHFLSRARDIAAPPDGNVGTLHVVRKTSNRRNSTHASASSRVLKCNGFLKKSKLKSSRLGLTRQKRSPSVAVDLGAVELPRLCGIYSIVHWMMAYTDVEGIQTMCLRVLPFLLENEEQRIMAQRAGLTDIVLRDMVLFPESTILHTAAFHTIVLLARPLGGQEGMLFHTSMVNSSGIFSSTFEGSASGKSGIAVLLDSMRRFQTDEVLQSMACWSLVNIALAPVQKGALVKLGGIEAILNSMLEHQYCAEVQFRSLFALINLVIPSVNASGPNDMLLSDGDSSEKEMIDDFVDQVVTLVVAAMRNFCSNEAVMNRACLVLHNLSLTHNYHMSMLRTPSCYQMLEWCLRTYRTDQVLQQSAAGSLHRLQMTLSGDATLRARFTASIQALQNSLGKSHCEALSLSDQDEQQADDDVETSSATCL